MAARGAGVGEEPRMNPCGLPLPPNASRRDDAASKNWVGFGFYTNHKLHLRVRMELAPLLPVLRHGRERLLGRAVRRGADRDGDGDVLGRHLRVFCVSFHAIDAKLSVSSPSTLSMP